VLNLQTIKNTSFKECSYCKKVWHSKEEFLTDESVLLNGYQCSVKNYHTIAKGGFILFTHTVESCGTTIALSAELFKENV